VAEAVERAIQVLTTIQLENGTFPAFGNANVESTVQVVVALTELQMDPLAENIYLPHIDENVNFITDGGLQDGVWTNNIINGLLLFWAENSGSGPEVGGFKHVTSGDDGHDGDDGPGSTVNGMATDQALYGLLSYDRFLKEENALYDMRDMKNGEYRNLVASFNNATFHANGNETTESYSPYVVIEIPEGQDEDGKIFKNWNTKADGTGTEYNAGEKLIMPEHEISLYAQFDYIEYSLLFEMNGGTFIGEKLPEKYTVADSDVVLPAGSELEYEDHEFAGWYEDARFAGEPVTVLPSGSTGDRIYYAK